jgi:hypothetical protein
MQLLKTWLCLIGALTLNAACNPRCGDDIFDVTVNITTSLRDSVAIINTPLKNMAFTINSTLCVNGPNTVVTTAAITDTVGQFTTLVKGFNQRYCEGLSCQTDLKVVPVVLPNSSCFLREKILKKQRKTTFSFSKNDSDWEKRTPQYKTRFLH